MIIYDLFTGSAGFREVHKTNDVKMSSSASLK